MKYVQAINDAMKVAMNLDQKVIAYGLGIDDPKRIFGSTKDLKELFGPERVFDMPTAENAMTGVAIGVALAGYRPVMVHQRLDFFLLALDQLVNAAAKWHYMFGAQNNVPMVIRLIVGRGWGQGPTHSQSLHSWFAHIPGLKVVMPRLQLMPKAFYYHLFLMATLSFLLNTAGCTSKKVMFQIKIIAYLWARLHASDPGTISPLLAIHL